MCSKRRCGLWFESFLPPIQWSRRPFKEPDVFPNRKRCGPRWTHLSAPEGPQDLAPSIVGVASASQGLIPLPIMMS